jgi:GNAT superfamily N-acetyltransferase
MSPARGSTSPSSSTPPSVDTPSAPPRPAPHRAGAAPIAGAATVPVGLRFRPVSDLDGPTLFRMFHQAHAHEFADVSDSWARDGLLSMRYVQQRVDLCTIFPDAIDVLAERDGVPCARMVSVQRQGGIHVLGLFVLREHRGHGIGRHSLQRLCGIAQAHGCRLSLRVDAAGPDSAAFAEHAGLTVAAGADRLMVIAV